MDFDSRSGSVEKKSLRNQGNEAEAFIFFKILKGEGIEI
jgi:hypothetical protein